MEEMTLPLHASCTGRVCPMEPPPLPMAHADGPQLQMEVRGSSSSSSSSIVIQVLAGWGVQLRDAEALVREPRRVARVPGLQRGGGSPGGRGDARRRGLQGGGEGQGGGESCACAATGGDVACRRWWLTSWTEGVARQTEVREEALKEIAAVMKEGGGGAAEDAPAGERRRRRRRRKWMAGQEATDAVGGGMEGRWR